MTRIPFAAPEPVDLGRRGGANVCSRGIERDDGLQTLEAESRSE